MSASEPLLILVPARGGSKGIPRKVLQPVAGVPLLLRTLRTARESYVGERIVVSTEDREIASIARLHGFEVLDRPAELAGDTATIKCVARHAFEALAWDGPLLVMQPTCPLLRPETVRAFVEEFRGGPHDWAISGYRPGHLYWQSPMEQASLAPLTRRSNRQHAVNAPDVVWQESGALQIWRGHGASIRSSAMIPIPEAEALDIDTPADLFAAERALGRRTIGFRVVVGREVGSGHFWRCLRLTEALSHHDVSWRFVGKAPTWATDILDQRGISWRGWESYPELVVVDALDAAETIVPHAKTVGSKVVLFEHEGPATNFADLVIDEFADPKWVVLRPEFLGLPEQAGALPWDRPRTLVTFGGTDPSGLSARFGPLLRDLADVRLIQGPGAAPVKPPSGVEVVTDACMAEEMRRADLVVTSQGRTVSEAVACGTPVVSIAANERESRHVRIPGVLYLGLHAVLSDSTVAETVGRLLNSPSLRHEMAATASAQVDGLGVRRIVRRIDDLLEGL